MMRTLSLILGALILTLIATEVTAMPAGVKLVRKPAQVTEGTRGPARIFSCKVSSGYVTAIGKGSSQLAAKEAARELCGSKMIDLHIERRGKIADDLVDDLALACVNLECQ